MFQAAFQIADGFTRPIIASSKTIAGSCQMSIGAYVVLNDEGWIITAFHILRDWMRLQEEVARTKQVIADRVGIENDASISRKDRARKLRSLPRLAPTACDQCSLWFGIDNVTISEWAGIEAVDVAIAKFANFDPKSIPNYPVIKDPSKGYSLGATLARIGFPFQSLVPTWEANNSRFVLPIGGGIPIFLNDGILSRMIALQGAPGDPAPPVPLLWIETSNPGLKGQSGGPIFDSQGSLWGIQSNTASYPLDFEPPIPGRGRQTEYQFLNVGRGIHAETIVAFLKQRGVNFTLSNY